MAPSTKRAPWSWVGSYSAKPLAPTADPVALTFGPSRQGRALYYAEYFSGQIRLIMPW